MSFENLDNCPFCDSRCGHVPNTSHHIGCTNHECPEQPMYYDPVGQPDYVIGWWEEVQETASDVKEDKRLELKTLAELVDQYYK